MSNVKVSCPCKLYLGQKERAILAHLMELPNLKFSHSVGIAPIALISSLVWWTSMKVEYESPQWVEAELVSMDKFGDTLMSKIGARTTLALEERLGLSY